jgi:hypothetical protein
VAGVVVTIATPCCSAASIEIVRGNTHAPAVMIGERFLGMMDVSAMRRPSTPCTRNLGSTTPSVGEPIRAVHEGWKVCCTDVRIQPLMSSQVRTSSPGVISARSTPLFCALAATARTNSTASTISSSSDSVENML